MKKIIVICAIAVAVIMAVVLICVFSSGNDKPQATPIRAEDIKVTKGDVSRGDFLTMCMYLYEQVSGEVIVPKETNGVNQSLSVKKAYALGIITENDSAVYSDAGTVTREEAADILYSVMLAYKTSVNIDRDTVNKVLNGCYDNMKISHRDACAFIIQSGAVKNDASFYPSKNILSEEAVDWVNTLYYVYKGEHGVVFEDGKEIKCGYPVSELVNIMGQPQRIDESSYGGENYIYASDEIYAIFYVDRGVVRGFFANNGVKESTDSFNELSGGIGAYYRIDTNRVKQLTETLRITEQNEFFEMINAYRAKNGMGELVIKDSLVQLGEENSQSVADSGIHMTIPEKTAVVRGNSIEDMYIKLVTLKMHEDALSGGKRRSVYAGAGLWHGSEEPCMTVLIDANTKVDKDAETDTPTQPTQSQTVYSGEVPQLESPVNEEKVAYGTPIVIRLKQRTTENFIVRVSNSETGENVVYSRVYGDSLVVSPDVLEDGIDYMVAVSVDSTGEERFAEISAVRYGTPETPEIVSPIYNSYVDTASVSIFWKSKYTDFTVTLYNELGEYLGSQRVVNSTEVSIDGFSDGKYLVEVAAHRKDTNDVMAIGMSQFFVQLNNISITRTESTVSFRENKYSSVFGGSLVYSTKEQADANMKTVTVPVWKMNDSGEKYATQMRVTVNAALADQVCDIFEEIFNGKEKFPIKSLGGYNWRSTATGSRSQHSYGTCIDINPDENYCIYNSGTTIGKYWKPYDDPYSITPDGDVMKAFKSHGWTWGGEWNSLKDYMHFSYLGG